tara:strand:+ start:364 stop:1842 length:1479 start_codon:yes stop_codon:yes gene_type:complete
MSDNKNMQGGVFTIDAINLVNQEGESVDIQNMVHMFRLYESIYNKFVTGDIHIIDGLDMLKNFKLVGDEYIRIAIKQIEGMGEEAPKEFSIDKDLKIYKIGSINRADQSTQTYVLKVCDPRMFTTRNTRVNRVMRGSYDKMLQNVLINEGHMKVDEFVHWEDTKPENQQMVVPNWTIDKFIDFAVNQSDKGLEDKAVYRNGMFFYQTLNGGFCFKSIDEMFQQEFPLKFSYGSRQADTETADVDANADGGVNTIIEAIEHPQRADTLRGMVGGAYASTQYTYDPIRKVNEVDIYSIDELFSRNPDNHLSGHPMIRTGGVFEYFDKVLTTDNVTDAKVSPAVIETDVDMNLGHKPASLIIYDTKMVHSFDNADKLDTDESTKGWSAKVDSGKLERRAMLEILQQNRIVITIPLRTDLSVGTIIELDIPPPQSSRGEDISDKMNDNRYLITDICVNGVPSDKVGKLYIECVKESYAKKIQDYTPLDNVAPPREV